MIPYGKFEKVLDLSLRSDMSCITLNVLERLGNHLGEPRIRLRHTGLGCRLRSSASIMHMTDTGQD